MASKSVAAAIVLACVSFGTNVFHLPFLEGAPVRSTIAQFVEELAHPQAEPYTPVARWIGQNVEPGQSIWSVPFYTAYPLMFAQPKAIYAWQFQESSDPEIAALPPIHIFGRVPPDYIIAFSLKWNDLPQIISDLAAKNSRYRPVATIDVFWSDMYRPELTMRRFKTTTNYDRSREAVYIFKRETVSK